jgi:HEAT repeat protein
MTWRQSLTDCPWSYEEKKMGIRHISCGIGLTMVLLAGCARRVPPPPAGFGADLQPPPAPAVMTESVDVLPPDERWTRQLDAPDPYVRQQAIHALGQQGEAGYRSLLAGLHSKNGDIRLACMEAMPRAAFQAHQDDLWTLLVGMLNDQSPRIRKAVVGRLDLFRSRPEQARALLYSTAANDPDDAVRHFAADMLICLDGSAATLRHFLRDDNPLLRKRAAEALGAVPGNGLPVLAELEALAQSDRDPAVQQTAADAVATIRNSGRSLAE